MGVKQSKDGSFVNAASGRATGVTYPTTVESDPAESFQWGDVSGDVLARTIDAVTERGHAISFAVNRPRTAGCITILAGEARPKYYPQDVAEAERILIAITNAR